MSHDGNEDWEDVTEEAKAIFATREPVSGGHRWDSLLRVQSVRLEIALQGILARTLAARKGGTA